MGIEELCALPVADLAAPDSVLFLWATFPQLPEALRLIKAWGFQYKSVGFVWLKKNKKADSWFYGLGFWTRANAEVCLLATRGHPRRKAPNVHQFIISPIEGHSKKPDEAREKIVALMGDVPRVELFARQTAPGWDVWGNEVEPTEGLQNFGAPAKSADFVGRGGTTERGELCKDYLMVLFLFIPANILQTLFSNLFVTAGKPGLGFGLSVLAGVANIILDYIFIVPCGLGIRGAALGTGFGYLLPTVAGLVYFARSKGTLSFTRPKMKWAVIGESCFNGSSEMVSQLATAVTTFLFNRTMMNLLGENGVAAITIIIYSQFLLNTLYIGYSMGIAPIIGFNYGNRNDVQQKRVFSISMRFIGFASVLIFAISMFGGSHIVRLFADDTSEVYQIAANGFTIFSYSFLFCGLNNFTTAMFTALSNGKVSAVLSFLRTFGLLAGGILLLPHIWGITGVWLAVPVAEGIMFVVSTICLIHYKKKYSY